MRKAAFLASEGWQQQAIARKLAISQGTVSQLLGRAKKDGLLVTVPHFRCEAEERESLRRELYLQEGELQEKLYHVASLSTPRWTIVPELHVHHSTQALKEAQETLDPHDAKMAEAWDNAVLGWAGNAAPHVWQLLIRCRTCGIAWGRQCRGITDALDRMRHRFMKDPPRDEVHIAPLWGPRWTTARSVDDTVFCNHIKLSSNALAEDLTLILNRGNRRIFEEYELAGIDLVPFTDVALNGEQDQEDVKLSEDDEHWRQELRHIDTYRRDLEEYCPGYRKTFGQGKWDDKKRRFERDENWRIVPKDRESRGLARELDGILMSCGPSGTSRSFPPSENTYGGVDIKWLQRVTVGDLGGVIFAREGIEREPLNGLSPDAERKRQFERLRQHWLGVTEEHLRSVADRAVEEGLPGNIVLAVGTRRRDIVTHSLKRSLINHLFVDHTLADALNDWLDEQLAPRG